MRHQLKKIYYWLFCIKPKPYIYGDSYQYRFNNNTVSYYDILNSETNEL